jgi:hypothetical protein
MLKIEYKQRSMTKIDIDEKEHKYVLDLVLSRAVFEKETIEFATNTRYVTYNG